MTKFKLKIAHTDYWFWVHVHDDLKAMRTAAARHDDKAGAPRKVPGAGIGGDYYARALGVTHRFTRVTHDKAGEQQDYANIGIIQLAAGHITTEIVAHELIHAVMWAYRLKYNSGHLGRMWTSLQREERMAHMYGMTFREVTRILHKKGFWS
jgi:hypothetical protein